MMRSGGVLDVGTLQSEVAAIMEGLRNEISQAIETTGTRASGRTQASMVVTVEATAGGVHATLTGRRAFQTLERGRRPGKVPQNFRAIIMQWIIDKGIAITPIPYKRPSGGKYTPIERGLRQMAFFIARKIRREGTSLYRRGGRADIYSPAIERATKRLDERLKFWFDSNIEHIKINTT